LCNMSCRTVEDNEDIRCPVPSLLIREELRDANIKRIVAAGHFDSQSTKFSRLDQKCRCFLVSDDILDQLTGLTVRYSAEEYLSLPKVNLFTGRQSNQPERSKLTLEPSRRPAPLVIEKAVRTIENNRCFFNLAAIEEHVRQSEDAVNKAIRDHGVLSRLSVRELCRYRVDHYCWFHGVL